MELSLDAQIIRIALNPISMIGTIVALKIKDNAHLFWDILRPTKRENIAVIVNEATNNAEIVPISLMDAIPSICITTLPEPKHYRAG